MLWSAGKTWHLVLFDADEGQATPGTRLSFKQSSKEHKGDLLTGGIFQTTKAALPCVQSYPEGFQNSK